MQPECRIKLSDRLVEQVSQSGNRDRVAGWALIDISLARGQRLCVIQAARITALTALGLGQPVINPGNEGVRVQYICVRNVV